MTEMERKLTSSNPMDEPERELRRKIAKDIRLWASEMAEHKQPEGAPKLVLYETVRERVTADVATVANLVEGGFRGNCSMMCDTDRHEKCTREGCVCECHQTS